MYKIIKDNKVIDVVKYADFIRFLPAGQVIRTSADLAQGIVGSDYQTIYSFGPASNPIVTIKEITLEEFNRLRGLLNSEQEICADESILTEAKATALKHLSSTCKDKITAGFSIKLSDGMSYNFKLTTEDQLNLMNLENQLNSGAKTFVYHATDLPCKVFTREDVIKILKAYRKHVLYHTTYFNTVKQYITSCTDLECIKAFIYGTDVSHMTTDPTIWQILKNGGSYR